MQFQFDQDANARSIAINPGEVARTIEIADMVYIDVDASGGLLGIEFVSADEFVPFLRRLNEPELSQEWKERVPIKVRKLSLAPLA
jgi:uncharacterized protein YuzE